MSLAQWKEASALLRFSGMRLYGGAIIRGLVLPVAILASMAHALAADLAHAEAAKIDAILTKTWKEKKVSPNPPASDEIFLRRIYLDIVGRIPTLHEARQFHDNPNTGKRAVLIEHLLGTEAHAKHMFSFWADILRVHSRANGGQGEMTSQPYVEHIKKRLRENQPYDKFVHELLTAQGKVWENPAIGYYMRDLGMPLDNLANTMRVFLGTRIECAQCHNHPFDKWTQMQFYQMAAFTYPLETNFTGIAAQDATLPLKRRAEKSPDLAPQARWLGSIFENLGDFVRYSKVQALPVRQLRLPHDYQYTDAKPKDTVRPSTIMGTKVECNAGQESVRAFADWMVSPKNPRFTKTIANRLWKIVFGLGLIEPVDEIADSTEAVNPELMRHLEELMLRCKYDTRAFLKVLYNTQAYQRATSRRELLPGDTYHFTGPLLRRMTAEQIWDAFITLIHPTPDLPRRHGIDEEVKSKFAYKGKLSDALDLLSAEEIFNGTMKAAEAYEAGAVRSKILKDEYAAASKAKDKALMEKLNVDIRSLNFTARTGIHDHVVVPAVARLYQQRTGSAAPPPLPTRKPTYAELQNGRFQREYIAVPGYEVDDAITRDEAAALKGREAIYLSDAERYAVPAADLPRFLTARRAQAGEWMRAADIESPAPRGHYLREFGQSDRENIENANQEASIAQALVLMNGSLFDAINQPFTQLRLNVASAGAPEDQMKAVYQTLLTRLPTAAEKAAWEAAYRRGLDKAEDLIFALLNTQEFIFVQ